MSNKYNVFYKNVLLAAMENSTCKRLHVAAIIVKNGRICQSGWNGAMPGQQHCTEKFKHVEVDDESFYAAHGVWSARYEGHAEVSAIASAARFGVAIEGWEMAVTLTPCLPCAKAIIMAGIVKVYYMNVYDRDPSGLELLQECGIECVRL